MSNFIVDLMQEAWIMHHVKPCLSNLKRSTVHSVIMPAIKRLLDEHAGERKFVENVALELNKNGSMADIDLTLRCVERKVLYLLEERDVPSVPGFMSYMCPSLVGKFFYLLCKTTGYAVS